MYPSMFSTYVRNVGRIVSMISPSIPTRIMNNTSKSCLRNKQYMVHRQYFSEILHTKLPTPSRKGGFRFYYEHTPMFETEENAASEVPTSTELVDTNKVIKKTPTLKITYTNKLEVVEKFIERQTIGSYFGFDTETRPPFKKGERYLVSTVQICNTNDEILIFQTNIFHCYDENGLPSHIAIPKTSPFVRFLTDSRNTLCGIGTKNDYNDIVAQIGIQEQNRPTLIDLALYAKAKGIIANGGLSGYANRFVGMLNWKSKDVTLSRWDQRLRRKQLVYAANDAYASRAVYEQLLVMEPDIQASVLAAENTPKPKRKINKHQALIQDANTNSSSSSENSSSNGSNNNMNDNTNKSADVKAVADVLMENVTTTAVITTTGTNDVNKVEIPVVQESKI